MTVSLKLSRASFDARPDPLLWGEGRVRDGLRAWNQAESHESYRTYPLN